MISLPAMHACKIYFLCMERPSGQIRMWMQVQDVLGCTQTAGQLYWEMFSIIGYMIFAKQANENLLPAGTTLISRISDYATNQYGLIAMQSEIP
jgi:hypothetical protein